LARTPGLAGSRIMLQHKRIMRTTVDLPEHLLVEAKQLAAARRIPLTRVLEESLRAYLAEERMRVGRARAVPELPVVRGPRPVRGVDLDDTSALLEHE
jgi:hypothetical protein